MSPPADVPLEERYEVLSELGRGGMGVVYRARDEAAKRDVALKVSLTRSGGKGAARFEREGQVTASLDHPGIVRVFAAGRFQGKPALCYELVEDARELGELIGEVDLERRVRWVRDAARAVGYAHTKGVVHRDLKPSNILVDSQGRVRVADFGLAVAQDLERLTRTGELVGTPSYMAPEQFAGRSVDPASDVWALGVLLYEALCGEVPFQADSVPELIAVILRARPTSPRRIDGRVPRELESICLRALQPKAERRYPNGAALADDLDRFLDARPVEGTRALPGGRGPLALVLVGLLVMVGVWVQRGLSRTAPSAPPPTDAREAGVAAARVHLGAGRNEQALAAAREIPGPRGRLLEAEALLRLGRAELALKALDEVAPSRRATLEVEALLELGRLAQAERALDLAIKGGATPQLLRTRGLVRLLRGDLEGARAELKGKAGRDAVDLERRRKKLARAEGLQSRAADAQELLRRARAALPAWGRRAPYLAERVQTTVAEFLIRNMRLQGRGDFRKARTGALAEEALGLAPRGPGAQRLRLFQAWEAWKWRKRPLSARARKILARITPPAGWVAGLDPPLQGLTWALWFLAAPFQRVEAGERSLSLPRIADIDATRVRFEVRIALSRAHRRRAFSAYGRGDRQVAEQARTRALLHANRSMRINVSFAADDSSSEVVLARLLGGEVGAARMLAGKLGDKQRGWLLRAECDLVEGKPRAALDLLDRLLKVEPQAREAWLARAHARALLRDAGRSQYDLQQAKVWSGDWRLRCFIDWHQPDTVEQVVAGGWWPGKKP